MSSTISPAMGLVVPGIGTEPGPQWASDLNSSLSILDTHNHSPGSGVPITPDGLNISSDLSFLGNNATNLRSSRYSPQVSTIAGPLDLGCVYVVGVDLYYNDVNGNQIRITQAGGVAGASGSISGLVSPASATYVPGTSTFVWQSNVNTPAAMDNGSVTIRKQVANGFGVTLAASTSISANYTLTLPVAPPAQNSVLVMDTAGNVTTSASAVDLNLTGNLTVTGDVTAANFHATDSIDAVNEIVAGTDVTAGGELIGTAGVRPQGPANAQIGADTDQLYMTNTGYTARIPTTNSVGAGPYFIGGQIREDGVKIFGGDFTSALGTPVGGFIRLDITYTNVFDSEPIVTLGGYNQSTVSTLGTFPWIIASSASGFSVLFSGVAVTQYVNFLAFGARAS